MNLVENLLAIGLGGLIGFLVLALLFVIGRYINHVFGHTSAQHDGVDEGGVIFDEELEELHNPYRWWEEDRGVLSNLNE